MTGKLNPLAIPKGRDRDGLEQQPGDEQEGAFGRRALEKMDQAFAKAMHRQIERAAPRERKPPR